MAQVSGCRFTDTLTSFAFFIVLRWPSVPTAALKGSQACLFVECRQSKAEYGLLQCGCCCTGHNVLIRVGSAAENNINPFKY